MLTRRHSPWGQAQGSSEEAAGHLTAQPHLRHRAALHAGGAPAGGQGTPPSSSGLTSTLLTAGTQAKHGDARQTVSAADTSCGPDKMPRWPCPCRPPGPTVTTETGASHKQKPKSRAPPQAGPACPRASPRARTTGLPKVPKRGGGCVCSEMPLPWCPHTCGPQPHRLHPLLLGTTHPDPCRHKERQGAKDCGCLVGPPPSARASPGIGAPSPGKMFSWGDHTQPRPGRRSEQEAMHWEWGLGPLRAEDSRARV